MRTIEELSEEDVRDVLREGDDDYDNSLCINRDGEVLLIRDFFKNGPIGDGVILKVSELVHRRAIADNDADNDMVYLYTFHKGYGYVGQAAARDDAHVNKTFRDLKARLNEWKSIKGSVK